MRRVDPYTLSAFVLACGVLIFMVARHFEGSQIALVGVAGALATALGSRLVRASDDSDHAR